MAAAAEVWVHLESGVWTFHHDREAPPHIQKNPDVLRICEHAHLKLVADKHGWLILEAGPLYEEVTRCQPPHDSDTSSKPKP